MAMLIVDVGMEQLLLFFNIGIMDEEMQLQEGAKESF